jgi:L-alanine-DL-glutamate epimerase-like enolase superfamily enzyme
VKIARIDVWKIELPLREGSYKWSSGRSVEVFDATLVRIETEDGLHGWGEVCPLGPAYLAAYANGARTAIRELAPALLGEDPTQPKKLARHMDAALKGHAYAKSALDMACWDLFGKSVGKPVCELLGGRYGEDFALYRAISMESPDEMAASVTRYREEGYRRFQLKVGGRPEEDVDRIYAVADVLGPDEILIADANCGWLPHEAARVVKAVRDIDVYIEQPCADYEACLALRRRSELPFILDEAIDSAAMLLKCGADRAADCVNLKISKLGGLTRAAEARDLGVLLGLGLTIEDSWGGDVITAAIAHLAHSTPPEHLFTSTDFNSYVTRSYADGAPQRANGRLSASSAPGLGVEPRISELGAPLFSIHR